MPTDAQQTALDNNPEIKAALDRGFTLEDIADWTHLRDVLRTRARASILNEDPGSTGQQDAIDNANEDAIIASSACAAYARIVNTEDTQ